MIIVEHMAILSLYIDIITVDNINLPTIAKKAANNYINAALQPYITCMVISCYEKIPG